MLEKLQRWLPRVVNVLLLLGIAWLCYQLVLQFFPQESRPSTPTEPTPAVPEAVDTSIPPDRIADWHLFGESSAPGETDALSELPTIAPDTKLELALKGIVATSDKTQGYAIIQKPDKQEKHFKVDDSVFGLATLEEIYVDRIILQRNGRYETLRLPVEFLAGDPALERIRKKKIKQAVSDFRDTFLNRDVSELLELFGFDTAYKNGSFIGFVVKAMGDRGREMMATLGVEDGDLITVVNGMRLSESLEAVDRLKDLRNAATVDIIIERNGSEIPFHFDFEVPEGATVSDEGQIIQNTADGEGSTPGSPAGGSSAFGGYDKADDEIGEDYGSTEEEQAYIESQKARRTGIGEAVEYDH